MLDWMVWFGLAGIVVICELFTGTFYLLMIALGFAAGGVAALLGVGFELQVMVAAAVGANTAYLLRNSRFAKSRKTSASRDPNINLDIGQVLRVEKWEDSHARVMYRGALWDIDLAPGSHAESGEFVISEMRGSHLVVTNKHQ